MADAVPPSVVCARASTRALGMSGRVPCANRASIFVNGLHARLCVSDAGGKQAVCVFVCVRASLASFARARPAYTLLHTLAREHTSVRTTAPPQCMHTVCARPLCTAQSRSACVRNLRPDIVRGRSAAPLQVRHAHTHTQERRLSASNHPTTTTTHTSTPSAARLCLFKFD